jgi:tetratricopeptide (TPR) repeat protein
MQDAHEHYKRMKAIAEQAAAAQPGNLDLEFQLANSELELGNFTLRTIGDAKTAVSYFKHGLELRRRRLAIEPDSDEAKRGLANGLGQLAMCYQILGELKQAKALYIEEMPLRNSLSPAAQGDFETRRELSGLFDQLGSLAMQERDVPTARKHYDRCYSIRRKLAEENPGHLMNLRDLNRSVTTLGELCLIAQNDPAAARVYYEQSLATFRRLLEQEPATTQKADVSSACYFLATALLRLGETAKAQALYRECLEIRRGLPQDPDARMQQIGIAVPMARCGEHGEAARIVRHILTATSDNPRISVEAACALALCAGATDDPAQKSKYTEETVAALRRGCAEGWEDFERFRVDPDLDPVRGDPAFKQLLQDVQKPAKPAGS